MPGIVLTFGAALVVERHEAATKVIPTEPGYVSLELLHTRHARAHLIAPDSYAWSCFTAHDCTVILDGLIYNLDASDVKQQLGGIALVVSCGEDPRPAVRSFVDRCDGVFNAFVYYPAGPSLLVFNDRWGRLPLFHSCTSDRVVITREPKFVFPFLPEIVFDRYAIAEFILCGFVLGEKTLAHGISPAPPSTLLTTTIKDEAVRTTIEQVLPISLAEAVHSIPREEIVRTVRKLLLSSTASRVRTLQGLGYKLTADLSGGFDTRAVFSALCATGADVEYRTDSLFTGDEAVYARRVAALFGREVRSFVAEHPMDYATIRRISYLMDCGLDALPAVSSYFDAQARRTADTGTRVARFGGFGVPQAFLKRIPRSKRGFGTMTSMMGAGHLVGMAGLQRAAAATGLTHDDLLYHLEAYFSTYPEGRLQDRVRRFHFEYENKMVTYGDDRSRRFSWTVHPLWNKDLVTYAVSVPERCIPPRLLYFQLLHEIDPRLVAVPIWNGREYNYSRLVDLPDRVCSAVMDAARMAAAHSKLAAHAYRAARARGSAPRTAAGDVLSKVMVAYNSPQPLASLTTSDGIMSYAAVSDDYGLYRLLTFLSYYRELEARYGRSAVHIE